MNRRWLQLNENHLLIAYYFLAFLFGGALALLHTYWQKSDATFFLLTLQYPAEYAHSCGLVFLLSLTALAFMRGRAIQGHRNLRYPYWASAIVNAIVLVAMVWVGSRGVDARIFVAQDYYLIAVVFTASLAMLIFDGLAWRSRIPTIGYSSGILSFVVAALHVLSMLAVIVATVNLEMKELSESIPIR